MKRAMALLAGLAAVVLPIAVVATPAGATKTAPSTFARVLTVHKLSSSTANVLAVYRCTGAPTLWVSVKQENPPRRDPALTQEGSSQTAINSGGVWLDTHRVLPICDSRIHVQNFLVDKVETGSPGSLQHGWAWVQFCLFDDNYPIPPSNPESGVPYSDMHFRYVI